MYLRMGMGQERELVSTFLGPGTYWSSLLGLMRGVYKMLEQFISMFYFHYNVANSEHFQHNLDMITLKIKYFMKFVWAKMRKNAI